MIDIARIRQELPTLSRKHAELRQFFPALNRPREGRLPIFLDGPGGTQVPEQVIDSLVEYLRTCNANHVPVDPGKPANGNVASALCCMEKLKMQAEALYDSHINSLERHLEVAETRVGCREQGQAKSSAERAAGDKPEGHGQDGR